MLQLLLVAKAARKELLLTTNLLVEVENLKVDVDLIFIGLEDLLERWWNKFLLQFELILLHLATKMDFAIYQDRCD